ncbi:TetR/AcrR family transcriptional regulator [Agriterribacter sp.]|uniref:TetR/AcrR family transcriptional regulator n=1 Tax=Agriterribacter sp. TaxID=2821509 RepID=UPI002C3F6511|nr:TetR/AcrR family transcriptional regulator [Agriterribacter sp.]HRO46630.1 TetR/AcrR family transcriptional regulator [Agriterribacter sp.]HRQ17290.1 TetR/AcrR family transcriptional regulator [Agriterribacter sp.]
MKAGTSIKQESIIEAALKRFIHFGFNKTTFADIARDLGVSQQNLYYYFPDKKALVAAVLNSVITEYIDRLTHIFSRKKTLAEKMTGLVEAKEFFFEKYYMLSADHSQEAFYNHRELTALMEDLGKRQQELVEKELEAAIYTNEIKAINVPRVAALLLDTLAAMQEVVRCRTVIPDHTAIAEGFRKQKELIVIYVAGLKSCTCSNKGYANNKINNV